MDKVQLENQHYTTTINSLKKELEEAHLNFEEENKLLVGRVQHLQGEFTQSEGQLGNLQSEKLKLQNSHDTLSQNLTQTQSDFEKKNKISFRKFKVYKISWTNKFIMLMKKNKIWKIYKYPKREKWKV